MKYKIFSNNIKKHIVHAYTQRYITETNCKVQGIRKKMYIQLIIINEKLFQS